MRTLTAVSDRFELIEVRRARGAASFADEVSAGLTARSKHLSSKFFYDDIGSTLFDAITLLPEYYLTRCETEILREWGWQIVRLLDAPLDFLELGSGSAIKTRLLIDEALRIQGRLRYSPVDISKEALRVSSMALVDAYPKLAVRAYAGDYFDVLAAPDFRRGFDRKVLAMFMGSNVGNYQPAQARGLLALFADALRPGDGLLLGTDLKKDAATIELAYDDPTGVTAAFDKNVLARINRELDADFDLRNFTHVVRYDADRGVLESFLEARDAAAVELRAVGKRITFAAGERIHTESSYKFSDDDVAALGVATGFALKKTWHDRAHRFSVHLLVRD
ncbi:MAG: L-histidine N(alpha)-methyltransferase [Candidatus Eremiobacteraeota bacterium]|nr:L-histidine N(alpha)-methyltransferase [Candidatus Eremiobacteraeota bacterium]